MTEKLKPCPFCGGSNLEVVNTPQGYFIDCSCGCFTGDFGTEAKAIAAWNTRAERTCRNLDKHHNIMFKCSECGHWECQDFDGEKILPQTWNYCPNCGAKVVDA